MYGSNPYYNQQAYQQDLQNIIQNAQTRLNQLNNQPTPQQQVPITQNFQLAPTQNNNGIRFVNSLDDVKKELVFNDTMFVNKEYTQLWVKSVAGEIKTYELKEIIELDEKDRKIADLMAKIDILEKEKIINAKYDNANVNESTTTKKSTNVSNDKSSNK